MGGLFSGSGLSIQEANGIEHQVHPSDEVMFEEVVYSSLKLNSKE